MTRVKLDHNNHNNVAEVDAVRDAQQQPYTQTQNQNQNHGMHDHSSNNNNNSSIRTNVIVTKINANNPDSASDLDKNILMRKNHDESSAVMMMPEWREIWWGCTVVGVHSDEEGEGRCMWKLRYDVLPKEWSGYPAEMHK